MKLKITEPGWENFSGNLGVTMFDGGVSINEVPRVEINCISASIRVVELETGESVGALGLDADAQNKPCTSHNLKNMEEIFAEQAAGVAPAVVAAFVAGADSYTKEELEKVADKGGIAGLREIAEPLGLKGTSIGKLIELILAKQSGVEPNAAPLAEGQAEVAPVEQGE